MRGILLATIFWTASLAAADYKAGVSRQIITPDKPTWMIGYAGRNHPSDGVIQDLWAKALAIEDSQGAKTVIVTMDLACISKAFADGVTERIALQWSIPRERVLLNVSHNHSGPLLEARYPNGPLVFDMKPAEWRQVQDYTRWLGDALVEVVKRAIEDLTPAELAFGRDTAGFAANRRERTPDGTVKLGYDPDGPVDHDVPVILVTGPGGKVKAIVFGYACHNTTLGGNMYKFNGDYAGYALEAVEKAHPGATAMFIALCGGDQNPRPHGTLEMAKEHGAELAGAVDRALAKKTVALHGALQCAYVTVPLKYKLHSREQLQAFAKGANPQRARYGKAMLEQWEELSRPYPYPAQAIRFGRDLTILALGGEAVVEYQLWAKQQFGADKLIVAAYSNDEMAYIPTAKMLPEGGHEAVQSMFVYGHPGFWDPEIESSVKNAMMQAMRRAGYR